MLLSANPNICASSGLVSVIYLLIMGYIFLLLCMLVNFLLGSKHHEFYPIGCWILELFL